MLAELRVAVWGHAAETGPTPDWIDGEQLTYRKVPEWRNNGEAFLAAMVVLSDGTLAGLRRTSLIASRDPRDVVANARRLEPRLARLDELLGPPEP